MAWWPLPVDAFWCVGLHMDMAWCLRFAPEPAIWGADKKSLLPPPRLNAGNAACWFCGAAQTRGDLVMVIDIGDDDWYTGENLNTQKVSRPGYRAAQQSLCLSLSFPPFFTHARALSRSPFPSLSLSLCVCVCARARVCACVCGGGGCKSPKMSEVFPSAISPMFAGALV